MTSFWAWFSGEAEALRAAMLGRGGDRNPTAEIDHVLAAQGLELAYDLAVVGEMAELTFTPQGDPKAAAFVDEVVSAAPATTGWWFHSRRQRKPLSVALDFVQEVHGLDLSQARLRARSKEGVYQVCFVDAALAARPEEERYAIAGTFLDHALGEAVATEWVAAVAFEEGPGGVEMSLVINQIIHEAGTAAGAPTVIQR